ncbi:MAG: hypothetical protein NVS1B4_08410 [Gemmatimonadaceae bacterium]
MTGRASRHQPSPFVLQPLAWVLGLATFCTVAACYRPLSLPAALTTTVAPSGVFQAGFARVDITPPPGAGLMGWGPEGPPAAGHRQRLFARAMYLEDQSGARVAIVSADLGESSIVLHRRVAARVQARTGLGADRILLSATHTHSGPSHYFGVPAFDEFGSAVSGFDAVLADTLVARIAKAIIRAYDDRQRARAAWGLAPVWGFTRIRSLPAYRKNPAGARAALRSRFSPAPALPERAAGVDPTLTMLRVDLWDTTTHRYRRSGGLSIFAIHGTIVGSGQNLYDSDVQGRIATLMEQFMDTISVPSAPRSVHLVVNGGEGDVSPYTAESSKCPTPRLVSDDERRGLRGGGFETRWQIIRRDRDRDASCTRVALHELSRVATGVATQARSLYGSLEGALTDTFLLETAVGVLSQNIPDAVGRRLCPPRVGVATVLGAEDGWTRLRWDWTLLGADTLTHPSLPATARVGGESRCQGTKRDFLGWLQTGAGGGHALPDHAQIALVRIGPVAMTFVPGEPTTHAAWTIRRAVATALSGSSSSADSVAIVSLTNGYIQYITTPEEYALQLYEGAATIYGPDELLLFTNAFRTLAASLSAPRPDSAPLPSVNGWSKASRAVTRWDDEPNPSTRARPWRELSVTAESDEIHVRWIGPAPSAFYTSDGPSTFFERRRSDSWEPVAWDNLPEVEVRVERRPGGFAFYHVVWRSAPRRRDDFRVHLTYCDLHLCRELSAAADSSC